MNVQQATFVEDQLTKNKNLDILAQKFYEKYGSTTYCLGPCDSFFENGRKVLVFSKFDGYDLKNEAERFLRKKL